MNLTSSSKQINVGDLVKCKSNLHFFNDIRGDEISKAWTNDHEGEICLIVWIAPNHEMVGLLTQEPTLRYLFNFQVIGLKLMFEPGTLVTVERAIDDSRGYLSYKGLGGIVEPGLHIVIWSEYTTITCLLLTPSGEIVREWKTACQLV